MVSNRITEVLQDTGIAELCGGGEEDIFDNAVDSLERLFWELLEAKIKQRDLLIELMNEEDPID